VRFAQRQAWVGHQCGAPRGTSAAELIAYLAAPLYYRLLVTAEPLTRDAADLAAAAALAAARAGVFVSPAPAR